MRRLKNAYTVPLIVILRKKVSFRKDIFTSVHIFAEEWESILFELNSASCSGNYVSFMEHLRDIKGLGVGSKRLCIKIPLILRELRCQNVYKDIPGELCCVPDERVKSAAKELGFSMPSLTNNLSSLITVSRAIYKHFGDLYDIPLFAYEDLKGFD